MNSHFRYACQTRLSSEMIMLGLNKNVIISTHYKLRYRVADANNSNTQSSNYNKSFIS